jgi:hypothetical protein
VTRNLAVDPSGIQIGDVITSDPRRDFDVIYKEVDGFGGLTVYTSDSARAYINPGQTVTVRRDSV